MAFDTSCWKLAKSFLEDGPRCLSEDVNQLAQAIQDVSEDHCRMIEDQERVRAAIPPGWQSVQS